MVVTMPPVMWWFLAGIGLCAVELVIPTAFTAFIMGLSAFLIALLLLVWPLPTFLQVVLWVAISLLLVYLSHRWMPRKTAHTLREATEAEMIAAISPGQFGRVFYEGGSWRAKCGDETIAIQAGERVYVVGREGTTLIVLPRQGILPE